jgi:hypothetical protein
MDKTFSSFILGLMLKPIAKPQFFPPGHAWRSEESRIFKGLRSFASFRMTKKTGFVITARLSQHQDKIGEAGLKCPPKQEAARDGRPPGIWSLNELFQGSGKAFKGAERRAAS